MVRESIDRTLASVAGRRTALTAGLACALSLTGLELAHAQDATPEATGTI